MRITRLRVRILRMAQLASTRVGRMPPNAIKPSQGDSSATNANTKALWMIPVDIAIRT